VSFDAALAQRLAGAAIDSGGGLSARFALAQAFQQDGRFEKAEALFAALNDEATTDSERAMVSGARAINLAYGRGQLEDAEKILARAASDISDVNLRDELTATRGWVLYGSGRPMDTLAALATVTGRAGVAEPTAVRAWLVTALALAISGRANEAMEVVDRWAPSAERMASEFPLVASQFQSARVLALWLGGSLSQAQAVAEHNYSAAVEVGTHEGHAEWSMIMGAVALHQGRLRTAARWLREAGALLRELDLSGDLLWSLTLLALAQAEGGQSQAAQTTLAEATTIQPMGNRLFEFDLGLAQAWLAAARGDMSAARAHVVNTSNLAEGAGRLGFAVLGWHDLARLGDPTLAATRLADLVPSVQGALAPACLNHAVALAAGDATALERAATAFADVGANLRAAEAATQAATAYSAAGKLASARAASARARLLAERCEGARTPALATATEGEELTGREREIALLASSGLSSGVIAQRLAVSRRTVDNHLQHVYRKLGVTARRELRSVLEIPSPE
jgi:ATP/maltotriose-dependent transcriptional regulator MalT